MRELRSHLVAATALLALAGLLALSAGAGAAAASGKGKSPKNFSAIAKVTGASTHGRTAVFHERLKVGGRKAGSSKLKCRFSAKATKCSGRWKLRQGTIKAKGKLGGKGKPSILRIRKGTGAYKGARGKVRIETVTKRRNRETFKFK